MGSGSGSRTRWTIMTNGQSQISGVPAGITLDPEPQAPSSTPAGVPPGITLDAAGVPPGITLDPETPSDVAARHARGVNPSAVGSPNAPAGFAGGFVKPMAEAATGAVNLVGKGVEKVTG